MSESKKGIVRIFSNYTRLLITFALGIIVVPLTIRWLGDQAFGIISLLGANLGLASIFLQIIQMSLVRELGHAFHQDEETFQRNYATICVIAMICAALTVISFTIVFMVIPVFNISPEFVGPARVFVVGQGLYTAAMVLLAPILNMYLVKERFVGYNVWYIAVRAGNILSVLILGYVIVIDDPALGLSIHGLVWAGLSIIGMLIAAILMVRTDHRLMFRMKGSDKDARSQVLSTFSWNTGVQVAMNLHEQIPPLLLNLFSGIFANAAWGIGFRFVAYIRMCTTGVQFGSDAVSARMASGTDTEESNRQLQKLIGIQTKLTAMIALPAGIVVFVYGWPIFDVWVGGSLEDYNAVIPVAVFMSRVLAIALISRAISETWLIILYGAGYVKAYAPWVFAGGIFAPIASLILMLTLPRSMIVYAPPAVYAFVLVVVHLFGLPIIAGRCLNIQPSSLLLSLMRPLLATLIAIGSAIGLLMINGRLGDLGFFAEISLERGQEIAHWWVLGSIGVFCVVYAAASFAFVLGPDERQRITGMIRRRLGK